MRTSPSPASSMEPDTAAAQELIGAMMHIGAAVESMS